MNARMAAISLVESVSGKWLVPILMGEGDDERLIGSGVLLAHGGRLFLMTAAHVLRDDEHQPWPDPVWFIAPLAMRDPATQRARHTHLRINHESIVFMPDRDVAFVPLEFLDEQVHESFVAHALPGSHVSPVDAASLNGRGLRPFIVGFPEEFSYSESGKHMLQPMSLEVSLGHASHATYASAQAAAPNCLVGSLNHWSYVDKRGEFVEVPGLSCVSGGAWLLVDKDDGVDRVVLIALHQGRAICRRRRGEDTFAYGTVLPPL